MDELQTKGVFRDPFFLYDQFTKAREHWWNEGVDAKVEGDPFWLNLVPVYKEIINYLDRKEATTITNSFFKEFSKIITHTKNYCERHGLSWDVYPYFKDSKHLHYRCQFHFVIKLKDFDLIGKNNKKVWAYKEPYFYFQVGFQREGLHIDSYNMSLFFGKYDVLGLINGFNHPHCSNKIGLNMLQPNVTSSELFGKKLNHDIYKNSLCLGDSRLSDNLKYISVNQEEYDFFMLRLTNYIKEYNSDDCYKKVPSLVSCENPTKTSILEVTDIHDNLRQIVGEIKKTSFDFSNKYFKFYYGEFVIIDSFYTDLTEHFINNREEYSNSWLNGFLESNLKIGENNLKTLLSLSTEKSMFELQLNLYEESIPDLNHFIFNGQKVKFEVYFNEDSSVEHFDKNELSLNNDAKTLLKKYIL
tara:strand:- start:1585 stop:2826 length:1242 start_codon:yes stop_codon:yes gene_type:complete